ncbi:hypothetical protein ALO87_200026 [Pseudomonas syringae pv. apii]|nr:hypothetical protein ALO87_200026 [Pseudomonas syringae pv. apii]
MVDQVQAKRFAARLVVGPAGDLDQAPPTIELAVAISLGRIAQALGQLAGVVLRQVGAAAQLADVTQLSRLVAHLGNERRDAQPRDDLVLAHCCVQDGCKNAGFLAGAREYLQQLLRGDRHLGFSKQKNTRSLAGCV